jgi:hypothetical protein
MIAKPTPQFPHRLNHDGVYDSICRVCLATVASLMDEQQLARHEDAHVCNPTRLYHLGKFPISDSADLSG